MSEIKPALTAEEWRMARVHVSLYPTGEGAMLQLGNRHGIAAAALHRQSFGFTREDVEVLTDAVGSVYSSMEGSAKLLSIADRIEALLPPEESEGNRDG